MDNGCFSINSPLLKSSFNEKTSRNHRNVFHQKALKKKKQREEKLKKAAILKQKRKKTALIYQLYTTITHHFPALFEWMREIDDCRKKASPYELAAHLTACLAMFLFKTGSRNEYNQKRENLQFQENYEKLFGFAMPHGDSVHNVIALLNEDQVEQLKQKMVKALLERKSFHKSRYRGKWFRIAIDGSGVVSFDHQHCDQCLHTTSKKGKTHYYHNVLDARLITPNGFSISVATVWIENPEKGHYKKQDCERKAFMRLAAHLKKTFPRLSIIILADGLYPYEGFFAICKANHWALKTTFKEGNLPSLWKQVHEQGCYQLMNHHTEIRYRPNGEKVVQEYCWITDVDYKGYSLNWMECRETVIGKKTNEEGIEEEYRIESSFVHITDLPLTKKNIVKSSETGRMRWKIENEGFNTLKNGGYGMSHKWARVSYQGLKNYYQFMQMGHLINQLMIKNVVFQRDYLQEKNHPTLKSLWDDLISVMKWVELESKTFRKIIQTQRQFRFIT